MKINGTIFSKPQQDQLKRAIESGGSGLNYKGDWASGNEYHENDVVTWAQDEHLYEVIKAHTSSSTIDPSNTEYYKAMTARKFSKIEGTIATNGNFSINLYDILTKQSTKGAVLALTPSGRSDPIEFTIYKAGSSLFYVMAPNVINVDVNETYLYFGILSCNASNTGLNGNRLIQWAKDSENTIKASRIAITDAFTLYYEQ